MRASWPPPPPPVVPRATLPPQPVQPAVKVLHVVTRFIAGAGGNTLLSVLHADRGRYEMWVAGAPEGDLWDRAEAAGVRAVRLPHMREVIAPRDDLLVVADLVRLIRRERFSVVHTHSTKAGFVGRLAARLTHTPVVVHTIHGFAHHPFMSWRRRHAYLALERMARRWTHAFLAVAPAVALEAVELRLADPGSIRVAPSAVELDRIPDAPDGDVRAELGIPTGVPVVGTVGRLDPQKAPLDFVRMASRVARSHPGTRFVMVGDGSLEREAMDEARRLGVDVIFTGFRSDAARIASVFDVFVVSSLHEGLGRALTEALASGRPVAATAVNGVVDIVEPGSTGLLAPPAQPFALATNVAWLLDHPDEARQMGQAAMRRVRGLFAPHSMCALIEQTYAGLLGLPSTTPDASAGPPLDTAGQDAERSRTAMLRSG